MLFESGSTINTTIVLPSWSLNVSILHTSQDGGSDDLQAVLHNRF